MKFLIFLFTVIIFMMLFVNITRVEQNELVFGYNVTSGQAVSPELNPLEPFGFAVSIGWNEKFFSVSSESNNYNFTNESDKNSPYDEALDFDSIEGTSMELDYSISAHVDNPYVFYDNFGDTQYDYDEVEDVTDDRIYEAIRTIAAFVDIRVGELAEKQGAIEIQQNPEKILNAVKSEAQEYAKSLGMVIDDLLSGSAVEYPDGNAIQKARDILASVNSDFETRTKDVKAAEQNKAAAIADASIEADSILSEAKIEADMRLSEADAISRKLAESIKQVGKEAAFDQVMTEYTAQLIEAGVIREAYVDEKSLLGGAFYRN